MSKGGEDRRFRFGSRGHWRDMIMIEFVSFLFFLDGIDADSILTTR